MKRVYCLYRVSTKKQADENENDIPMQRTACRDFAGHMQEWTILKEFSEKGVFGHKVSADDRDAIQELKEAALKGEFDILLVFCIESALKRIGVCWAPQSAQTYSLPLFKGDFIQNLSKKQMMHKYFWGLRSIQLRISKNFF